MKQKDNYGYKKTVKSIVEYIITNRLFISYVVLSLIATICVRAFTIGSALKLKPFLTDLGFILVIGGLGYFVKPKNQFKYYFTWLIIFNLMCLNGQVAWQNFFFLKWMWSIKFYVLWHTSCLSNNADPFSIIHNCLKDIKCIPACKILPTFEWIGVLFVQECVCASMCVRARVIAWQQYSYMTDAVNGKVVVSTYTLIHTTIHHTMTDTTNA